MQAASPTQLCEPCACCKMARSARIHTHSCSHTQTHTRTHAQEHKRTHTRMHARTYAHTPTHTGTHTRRRTHAQAFTLTHTRTRTGTHMQAHARTRTGTHTHKHRNTQTHTHAQAQEHTRTHTHIHTQEHTRTNTHKTNATPPPPYPPQHTHTTSGRLKDHTTHTHTHTHNPHTRNPGGLRGSLPTLGGRAAPTSASPRSPSRSSLSGKSVLNSPARHTHMHVLSLFFSTSCIHTFHSLCTPTTPLTGSVSPVSGQQTATRTSMPIMQRAPRGGAMRPVMSAQPRNTSAVSHTKNGPRPYSTNTFRAPMAGSPNGGTLKVS